MLAAQTQDSANKTQGNQDEINANLLCNAHDAKDQSLLHQVTPETTLPESEDEDDEDGRTRR